jgi:DNA-binding MarR family transcriptional regulator
MNRVSVTGKSRGAEGVAAIERALVALRRSQSRRALARLSAKAEAGNGIEAPARPPDMVFELLDAIEAAGAATVTESAAALGVDQPRASRLAAQAVQARLLRRESDQFDGRRSLLVLTGDGREALARVRAFRAAAVAAATKNWAARDRDDLARLLTRFVDDFARAIE